jgi:hypothetical protein
LSILGVHKQRNLYKFLRDVDKSYRPRPAIGLFSDFIREGARIAQRKEKRESRRKPSSEENPGYPFPKSCRIFTALPVATTNFSYPHFLGCNGGSGCRRIKKRFTVCLDGMSGLADKDIDFLRMYRPLEPLIAPPSSERNLSCPPHPSISHTILFTPIY